MASTDEGSIRWKLMSHSGHLQVARDEEQVGSSAPPPFVSILFPGGMPELDAVDAPLFFRDLNLDQVVEAAVDGRDEYDLVPFFRTPLTSVEEIDYRHAVFRDIEVSDVRTALGEFGERMHRVRSFLTLVRKQHYRPEKQRWLLDAAALYTEAVRELARALADERLSSAGLCAFAAYLAEHVVGAAYTSLADEAAAVLDGLERVAYNLRINGTRVTVSRYEDEPDYSDEIEELFARFRQGDLESKLANVGDGGSMDHVEAQIADLVARLFPHEFEALRKFCSRHDDFIDPTIAAFDREIQFYLAWVDFRERVSGANLLFSYPEVSADSRQEVVEDAFDVALATKLRGGAGKVVCNGYRLEANEHLLVVTGPNQGGKTTFARMFGQLHYLAVLGVPIPARTAQLFLVDRIFTHFEREEVVSSLRGKLDDELVRVREILDSATGSTMVVLNEMFSSATLADARDLGTAVLNDLIARGGRGVCVTFIDELSRLGEATVSMVAQVAPDDPAKRTYRVLPQAADGRAYAWAIAKKYGLSYDQLRKRLS
jgi:DNA mismatch repair protein MutS